MSTDMFKFENKKSVLFDYILILLSIVTFIYFCKYHMPWWTYILIFIAFANIIDVSRKTITYIETINNKIEVNTYFIFELKYSHIISEIKHIEIRYTNTPAPNVLRVIYLNNKKYNYYFYGTTKLFSRFMDYCLKSNIKLIQLENLNFPRV